MLLNYRELGESSDSFIVMHGLLGASDNWLTLSREWAKQYRMILLDLRNHGQSPHSDVHTYSEMAKDVIEVMDEKNISQATILGHSMGGKVAMTLAQLYPERIKKLIVVDIAPIAYRTPEFVQILENLMKIDPQKLDSRKAADEMLKMDIEDAGLRGFLLKNLERSKSGGYQWRVNLPVLHKSINDIAGDITFLHPFASPTLFIRGEKSNYIREKHRDRISEMFPTSRISTVKNVGHWVHAEAPKIVHEIVSHFVAKK